MVGVLNLTAGLEIPYPLLAAQNRPLEGQYLIA